MFRRIVVPLDGTPFAEHAVPTAVTVARVGDGQLLLVHVLDPRPSLGQAHGVVVAVDTTRELEEIARAYLAATVRRLTADSGVVVDSELVSGFPPHEAIRRIADDRGADLIVMASHDRRMFGRLVAGSVAERVVREPGAPVLIVRQSESPLDAEQADGEATATSTGQSRASAAPFRHLLIPLDGSAVAEAVLDPAVRLARVSSAAITLVTVRDPLIAAAELPQHAAGAEYLATVAHRLTADGFTVEIRVMDDRRPAHAISRCAAEVGADVIAMSTRGHGRVARLLEGSVAAGVLHAAHLPVLLFHPDTDAPDAADTDRP